MHAKFKPNYSLQIKMMKNDHTKKYIFNPLSARIFTVFGHLLEFIRGQSVTQGSMGRDAPRYPSQYPGP